MNLKFVSNLGVFLLFFLANLSTSHAYLVKIGDSATCAFQCAEKPTCSKTFTAHAGNTCIGETNTCNQIAETTCGKGLRWVHKGPMNLNLDVEKISDAHGNQYSGTDASKQLDIIFQGMPIER